MAPSVVLVTGVSRYLGGHLAARLATDPSIERVLGVDTVPPARDLRDRMGRAEFVRADIRNPLIARVVARAEVDTVVHAALSPDPSGGGGAALKEMNVLGTMQLLAACQKAPSVRRMVLESTTAVYGASPADPALFDETMTPNDLPTGGYARDRRQASGVCLRTSCSFTRTTVDRGELSPYSGRPVRGVTSAPSMRSPGKGAG